MQVSDEELTVRILRRNMLALSQDEATNNSNSVLHERPAAETDCNQLQSVSAQGRDMASVNSSTEMQERGRRKGHGEEVGDNINESHRNDLFDMLR